MKISSVPEVQFTVSPDFTDWLDKKNCSLVIAMPKQNKIISFGQVEKRLKIFNRTIEGCSSIHYTGESLFVASKHQIWKFQNILEETQSDFDFDVLFWPKESWTIGHVDLHDMYAHEGITPIFVNTLFSCLSTLDKKYSFKVIWKPDFISKLRPEDRCHMSGMAVDPVKKIPRYITALGKTNSYEEWRLDYHSGGILMDIATNETVLDKLSLPYSPRIYNKSLYLLEAGRGAFVKIDPQTKQKEDICFLPGFARGLDFIDDYAVVATSKPRAKKTFEGLELEKLLSKKKIDSICGLHIINLKTGQIEHHVNMEAKFGDIYDVKIIKNKSSCSFIGFKDQDIEKVFYLDDE